MRIGGHSSPVRQRRRVVVDEEVVGRDRRARRRCRARRSRRRARARPPGGRRAGRPARAIRRSCRGSAPSDRRSTRAACASTRACAGDVRRASRRRGGACVAPITSVPPSTRMPDSSGIRAMSTSVSGLGQPQLQRRDQAVPAGERDAACRRAVLERLVDACRAARRRTPRGSSRHLPFCIASQTRAGCNGISRCRMPRWPDSASTAALTMRRGRGDRARLADALDARAGSWATASPCAPGRSAAARRRVGIM